MKPVISVKTGKFCLLQTDSLPHTKVTQDVQFHLCYWIHLWNVIKMLLKIKEKKSTRVNIELMLYIYKQQTKPSLSNFVWQTVSLEYEEYHTVTPLSLSAILLVHVINCEICKISKNL